MNGFSLTILNMKKTLFFGKAVFLSLPGAKGYFQVLADHADMVCAIKNGQIKFQDESGKDQTLDNSATGVFSFNKNTAKLVLFTS